MTIGSPSSRLLTCVLAVVLFAGVFVAPGSVQAPLAARASDPRLDWWREARFGMFIHWGLYAALAGEWNGKTSYGEWIRSSAKIPINEYEKVRERFNPTRFDADDWVRMAKAAGMKYIVITTKHHDGFGLFDSAQTDWDVMSTPYGRDILKQLAAACQREGIRLGFYYSIMDWHHPDYVPRRDWEEAARPVGDADFQRYVGYMKAQLKELLTGYGPIGVLWFDGQWEGTWNNERGRDLYDYVRSLQPSIIINNRVGRAGGDFGLDAAQGTLGDFGTPEQEIPATGAPGLDWETCMTMNDNWGYNRADKKFKSTETLVRNLVDIASKGGNFLLNVGPTGDGEFPSESVARLKEIGTWMQAHGASIYGTQASPFPRLEWGRATMKAMDGGVTRLYLHVFDYPATNALVVPGLLNEIRGAQLMGAAPKSLVVTRRNDDVVINLGPSPEGPTGPDTVVELDVAGEPDVTIPPVIAADAPIFVDTLGVRVTTSRRNVQIHYTIDGKEPTGSSPLVPAGGITLTTSATVQARAFRGPKPVSATTKADFAKVLPTAAVAVAAPLEAGLRFVTVEGTFDKLPDFSKAAPAKSGTVPGLDLTPRTRETLFAFEFTGYIDVPVAGVYTFFLRSDDGSRMWLDDALLVDNDGLHSSRERSAAVALEKGLHPVRIGMFEQSGGFELALAWSGPGIAKQAFPATAFRRK